MDDIAVSVKHISKTFKLPHEKQSSLKGALVSIFRPTSRTYEKQQVLKNINFDIKKGEFFGIVGRNGSGKSTLLKMLAEIYTPDSGSVEVNGKLTPFIELGVGFNPELTGRENVYLNGALLGFNRSEMDGMYDDIVAFAELEKFMDQKLKNYSSGMQVRLAFSIATRAKTDILLIDEVLAVGDQSFQEKCFDYFAQIKKSDKTVIFVTHDMSNVERFCDRVFVLDRKTEVNGLYTIPEAVKIYNQLNHEVSTPGETEQTPRQKGKVYIKSVELLDAQGKQCKEYSQGDSMTIKIQLETENPKEDIPVVLGLAFHTHDNINLAGPNSAKVDLTTKDKTITYLLKSIPFNMGEYYVTIALFDEDVALQYDLMDKQVKFFVNTNEVQYGLMQIDAEWGSR